MSYGGVYMCLLKNLRGKNPKFCQFADPYLTFWAPPFHRVREIGKSRTIVTVCGSAMTSIPNMVWVPHPWLRLVVALGHGLGRYTFEINITSAVWQLATRCLIPGSVLRVSLSDEDIAVVRTAPRGRLSSWPLAHILAFFIETPRCTRPLRKECYGMVILEAGCL